MKQAITAIIMASMPSVVMATSFDTANALRDALTDAYSDLGGNFGTSDAGQELAETMRQIDLISDTSGTNQYTISEINDQAEAFVDDLDKDMWGSDGEPDEITLNGGDEYDGLLGNHLEDILSDLEDANTIILDVGATQEEKLEAVDTFKDLYEDKKETFNDVTTTLGNVADTIGVWADADKDEFEDDWQLGGQEVDDIDEDGANIIIDDDNMYSSYSDWLTDTQTDRPWESSGTAPETWTFAQGIGPQTGQMPVEWGFNITTEFWGEIWDFEIWDHEGTRWVGLVNHARLNVTGLGSFNTYQELIDALMDEF